MLAGLMDTCGNRYKPIYIYNPRKPLSIPQFAILCSQINQPVSVPEWMFLSPVISGGSGGMMLDGCKHS